MRVKKRLTRLAVAVGAVALGAMGLVAGATAANAAPSYGNINEDAEGSMTIHKFLNQSGNPDPGDIGTGGQNFTDPVSGVVFWAYELGKTVDGNFVPLDLTDPDSWVGLSNLPWEPGCAAPTGYALSATPKVFPATDAQGAAELSNLDVGAYVICENDASNAKVNGSPVTVTQYQSSFVVTIPEPYDDGWIYDVHAFPKNRAFVDDTVRKSVSPQIDHGLVDGSPVLFPVTVEIPEPGVDPWTHGAISDVFQPGLKVATNPVVSVQILKANLTDVHHTFNCVEGTPSGTDECYIVRDETANAAAVVFTEAGLAKFDADTVGMSVRVVFEATADVATLGTGGSWAITNKAGIWTHVALPSDPLEWEDAETSTNSVTTSWGDVKIFKFTTIDEEGTKEPLADAEFELYDSDDAYPSSGTCGNNVSGSALEVLGSTVLRTGSDGEITVPGLFVSDSVNTPGKDSGYRCYVLKETKAPAGYVARPDNIPVKVEVGTGKVTIEVENTQQTSSPLPVTGAAGRVLMALAAVGIGAVAFGLLLVNKKRTRERS